MKFSTLILAIALLGLSGNLQAAKHSHKGAARVAKAQANKGKHLAKREKPHSTSALKAKAPRTAAQRQARAAAPASSALPGIPALAPGTLAHLERMLPSNLQTGLPESGAPIATRAPFLPEFPVFAEPSAPKDRLLADILDKAKVCLGTPYHYGGSSLNGFDCSGFVGYVYGSFGINLNRSSYSMATQGQAVPLDRLQPGDLLFFRTQGQKSRISHVGIYLGKDRFIHAASREHRVTISGLGSSYYNQRLVSARRVLTRGAELKEDSQPEESESPNS